MITGNFKKATLFKSIRGKMLFLFGSILLILFIILGTVTYFQLRDTVIPLTEELSEEILMARSSEVGRLIRGYANEVEVMAERNLIRHGDWDEIADDLTGRADSINPDFEMIFYADLKGDFITTCNLRGNISDRDYYKAIILGDEEKFISNPMVSRSTKELIFVIARAVYDEDEQKKGLIASTVLLETLSDIASAIQIGESGFGYIVDQNSLLIAHPDENLRMSLNLMESAQLGYEGLEEIGKIMREGEAGVLSYERPDGSKLITGFSPIPNSPYWSLGIALYEDELMGPASGLINNVVILMSLILVIVLLMVALISSRITLPILTLKDGVKTVSSGNLDYQLEINTGDEIEELAGAYNKMTADLKEHIKTLQQTTADKERIESELQIANKIQSSMLPRSFPPYPEIENLDLFATMDPAREVGGDYYDFFVLDNQKLCFSIGDVSGKGVPAALFMVIARTILKNQALQGGDLEKIFYQANNLLCSDNVEDMFVTVFMGIIDTKSGELEYINAGHNPPLMARRDKEYSFVDVNRNLVLGGLEDFHFKSEKVYLQPGDMFFIYTDGLTEAMNSTGEQFGEERTVAALNNVTRDDLKEMIAALKMSVEEFVQDTPPSDDLTMLTLTLKN